MCAAEALKAGAVVVCQIIKSGVEARNGSLLCLKHVITRYKTSLAAGKMHKRRLYAEIAINRSEKAHPP